MIEKRINFLKQKLEKIESIDPKKMKELKVKSHFFQKEKKSFEKKARKQFDLKENKTTESPQMKRNQNGKK